MKFLESDMKIKQLISQHRRDFYAIYECEHCHHTEQKSGYDDSFFHENVIPNMDCNNCGKKSDNSYRPLTTKYPDGAQI